MDALTIDNKNFFLKGSKEENKIKCGIINENYGSMYIRKKKIWK